MQRFILVIILSVITTFSFGWGVTGHRAVGLTAEKYMSKRALARVEKILGQSVAMAGTWMDEVRSDSTYDYMVDWHWVTIPAGQTYEQTEKNSHGDVIQTIERVVAALKSKSLTAQQEQEYIKILIHLVADVHQPLHVGTGEDRGGNEVKVKWFGSNSNLHRMWDSEMIDDTHLSYTELANSLYTPNSDELKVLQDAPVTGWAYESMSYRPNVYAVGSEKLSYEYTYKNFTIVRKRLMQAGVRLAALLNDIYG